LFKSFVSELTSSGVKTLPAMLNNLSTEAEDGGTPRKSFNLCYTHIRNYLPNASTNLL